MSKSKQRRKQAITHETVAAATVANNAPKIVELNTDKPLAYMAMMDFSQLIGGVLLTTRSGTKITDFNLIRAMLAGSAPIKPIEGDNFMCCPHCRHVFESGKDAA